MDKSKEIINNNFIQDKYYWEDIESINEKVYNTLLPYTNIIIQNSGADAD